MKKRKQGKYVYKTEQKMDLIHSFYDKAMNSLNVSYKEEYLATSFGKTHVLIVGDCSNPPIFTLHGGNGISPLNIRLFLPLLKNFCIIAPDVIGMPGKSTPYRNISTKHEEYGVWILEILDIMRIQKISFVVSSYSSSMLLSLAKLAPKRIDRAVLLVPSGIAHGRIFPMISKMAIPFITYYFKPSSSRLDKIIEVMVSDSDDLWREFFDLMMSSYKMEMCAPKEYKKADLVDFKSEVLIFASNEDIFFPARKVFDKAKKILQSEVKTHLIEGLHLPSEEVMSFVCDRIIDFLSKAAS